MKKFVIFLICAAILTGIAVYVNNLYTKSEEVATTNTTNSTEVEPVIDTEPLYSKEEYPKIDASLATQPLAIAVTKNFVADVGENDEEVSEFLEFSNTHPAYIKLIDGEKDLIIVTEPSEEELAYAKEKGVELEVTPVVREGFVFYVNAKNPVDGLTIKQIQDIYSGKITNWKEVGGEDEEIVPFQRPENSGSQTGMLSLVMKDVEIMEPKKEDLIGSMFDIVNLVSSYDNGINSIGYSYYYYATTMFDTLDSTVAERIKFLSIDGIEPSTENIKNETYPLETAYYIVIRKDEPESSLARKLKKDLLSERGQSVAEEAKYVGVK
jgi:phosphate transport system substrate-binding protein